MFALSRADEIRRFARAIDFDPRTHGVSVQRDEAADMRPPSPRPLVVQQTDGTYATAVIEGLLARAEQEVARRAAEAAPRQVRFAGGDEPAAGLSATAPPGLGSSPPTGMPRSADLLKQFYANPLAAVGSSGGSSARAGSARKASPRTPAAAAAGASLPLSTPPPPPPPPVLAAAASAFSDTGRSVSNGRRQVLRALGDGTLQVMSRAEAEAADAAAVAAAAAAAAAAAPPSAINGGRTISAVKGSGAACASPRPAASPRLAASKATAASGASAAGAAVTSPRAGLAKSESLASPKRPTATRATSPPASANRGAAAAAPPKTPPLRLLPGAGASAGKPLATIIITTIATPVAAAASGSAAQVESRGLDDAAGGSPARSMSPGSAAGASVALAAPVPRVERQRASVVAGSASKASRSSVLSPRPTSVTGLSTDAQVSLSPPPGSARSAGSAGSHQRARLSSPGRLRPSSAAAGGALSPSAAARSPTAASSTVVLPSPPRTGRLNAGAAGSSRSTALTPSAAAAAHAAAVIAATASTTPRRAAADSRISRSATALAASAVAVPLPSPALIDSARVVPLGTQHIGADLIVHKSADGKQWLTVTRSAQALLQQQQQLQLSQQWPASAAGAPPDGPTASSGGTAASPAGGAGAASGGARSPPSPPSAMYPRFDGAALAAGMPAAAAADGDATDASDESGCMPVKLVYERVSRLRKELERVKARQLQASSIVAAETGEPTGDGLAAAGIDMSLDRPIESYTHAPAARVERSVFYSSIYDGVPDATAHGTIAPYSPFLAGALVYSTLAGATPGAAMSLQAADLIADVARQEFATPLPAILADPLTKYASVPYPYNVGLIRQEREAATFADGGAPRLDATAAAAASAVETPFGIVAVASPQRSRTGSRASSASPQRRSPSPRHRSPSLSRARSKSPHGGSGDAVAAAAASAVAALSPLQRAAAALAIADGAPLEQALPTASNSGGGAPAKIPEPSLELARSLDTMARLLAEDEAAMAVPLATADAMLAAEAAAAAQPAAAATAAAPVAAQPAATVSPSKPAVGNGSLAARAAAGTLRIGSPGAPPPPKTGRATRVVVGGKRL